MMEFSLSSRVTKLDALKLTTGLGTSRRSLICSFIPHNATFFKEEM